MLRFDHAFDIEMISLVMRIASRAKIKPLDRGLARMEIQLEFQDQVEALFGLEVPLNIGCLAWGQAFSLSLLTVASEVNQRRWRVSVGVLRAIQT
jgi:hypothetical protein